MFATIINFCSNDYPYLRHCIDAVKPFSKQVIVPVCDHFFDGKSENRDVLNAIYAENGDVGFIEFPFNQDGHSSVYWHNLARLIGTYFLEREVEYVLFLDCDEVVDSSRFIEWLKEIPYQETDAVRFLGYWYFRESRFRAKTWENTPLLMRKAILNGSLIMNEGERSGMFRLALGEKKEKVAGIDGLPMVHHYSWVRTREQLLQKVASWGHNWQRDWKAQVEEEFSRPFNGRDFVHGYEFDEVAPRHAIDLQKTPMHTAACDYSHVRKLSSKDVIKIDISLTYEIILH